MRKIVSLIPNAVPFAFGAVRVIETRADYRYLVVAGVAFVGAIFVRALAARRHASRLVMAATVFLVAALCGSVAAFAMGTRVGPAMLIVAAAFAACFAASAALSTPRARSGPS